MKAAIIREAGKLGVEEMPEPRMGEYDALCELLYGATCTGTDSHIIDGSFPWSSPYPTVLGHESVGRVVAVGSKVRHFRIGDIITRVGTTGAPEVGISVSWGGFAEMGIAKDHWAMCADGLPEDQWKGSRWNQVLPYGVEITAAPMFTTWRETLSYITRMGVKAGANVLVVGSGGNGLSYGLHAHNLGATVTMAGAAYLEGPATAKGGIDAYLDYRRDDLTAALNKICPDGFDFIIDAVGKKGTGDKVLPCLKPGGVYGTYGLDDVFHNAIDPSKARGPFTEFPCSYDEAETHQQVSEFYMQGKLDASLWYDPAQAYPLDNIVEAFAAALGRKSPKSLVRLKA